MVYYVIISVRHASMLHPVVKSAWWCGVVGVEAQNSDVVVRVVAQHADVVVGVVTRRW